MIKNAIIKFFMDSPVIGYEKEDAVTRPGYIHWKTQNRLVFLILDQIHFLI